MLSIPQGDIVPKSEPLLKLNTDFSPYKISVESRFEKCTVADLKKFKVSQEHEPFSP
jgi:hypothetical protein